METIPEQTTGSIANPSTGLLAPPVHLIPRSGRKPQRSSPLAGPAVLVNDGEVTPSLFRVSSSPILNHHRNSLSPRISRQNVSPIPPRPKSMVPDYSTFSSHSPSLTPRKRSHASGTKQLIRPISSILPLSATQEHFFDTNSNCSQLAAEFLDLGEQCQNSTYRHSFPLTRTTKHVSPPTRQLNPPSIVLNETSIDVPQVPPPARSTSRVTGTIPGDNSWYITTAYEETPRFSRLGLSADNVVLPVSAKEFKKCQQQRQRQGYSSAKCPSGNRRSLLMSCALTSGLKLSRSNTRASLDHQLAQEPPSPFTRPTLSSQSSNTFSDPDSSPAMSATSSDSNLSRMRTSRLSASSSSTSTYFLPDIVTSSSQTSVNEKMTQESSSTSSHGKETQQDYKTLSHSRNRNLVASKTNRRTMVPGRLPEKTSVKGGISTGSPVVDRDETLRRGGMFKRFLRLFVSS